jgi:hypothetical protein
MQLKTQVSLTQLAFPLLLLDTSFLQDHFHIFVLSHIT